MYNKHDIKKLRGGDGTTNFPIPGRRLFKQGWAHRDNGGGATTYTHRVPLLTSLRPRWSTGQQHVVLLSYTRREIARKMSADR